MWKKVILVSCLGHYSISTSDLTRYIFAFGKNEGVDVVKPASSASLSDCHLLFSSQPTPLYRKSHPGGWLFTMELVT